AHVARGGPEPPEGRMACRRHSKAGERTVKSVSFKLMALGSLLATVCCGAPLVAQGPGGGPVQPQVPRTKIALVNLQQVVKSYEKWTQFEKSYKEKYQAYDRIFEAKKG